MLDMQQAPLQELQGLEGWKFDSAPFEYLGTRLGAKLSAATRLAKKYNLCTVLYAQVGEYTRCSEAESV